MRTPCWFSVFCKIRLQLFVVFLQLDFYADAPEFVRRDPRLVLGQKVGEDPQTMDDAKMTGVETETDLQFPWVEDVVKMVCRPREKAKELGGVVAGDERFSDKATAIQVKRETFGLPFAKIIVQ